MVPRPVTVSHFGGWSCLVSARLLSGKCHCGRLSVSPKEMWSFPPVSQTSPQCRSLFMEIPCATISKLMAEAGQADEHPVGGDTGERRKSRAVGIHAPDVGGVVGVRRVGPVQLAGGQENNLGTVGRPLWETATCPVGGGIGNGPQASAVGIHAPDVGGARRVGPVDVAGGRENNLGAVR